MILINGAPDDKLPITDRGLLYGDGLFETIAVSAGAALNFEAHLVRLSRGCRRLGIAAPAHHLLRAEASQVIGTCPRGVLKIIITRGLGGRGYRPDPQLAATRILMLQPAPDYLPANRVHGIVAGICHTRIVAQPELAGIKHLNRLPQVLARGEPDQQAFSESLMLDSHGKALAGTMSNLFTLRANTLLTPPLASAGVAGTVRQAILEMAPGLGWNTLIEELSIADLYAADEVFLSNSLIGIWPLRAIQDRILNVGNKAAILLKHLINNGVVPP